MPSDLHPRGLNATISMGSPQLSGVNQHAIPQADARLLSFAIRWLPFGAASDDEIFINFGMSRQRYFLRLMEIVERFRARIHPMTAARLAEICGPLEPSLDTSVNTAQLLEQGEYNQRNQIARNAETWEWQLLGRCRDEDASLFFHPDGERGHARKRRQQRAKAICAECTVAAQCRRHSLAYNERFGTWGGVSEDERNRILQPGGGPAGYGTGEQHWADAD